MRFLADMGLSWRVVEWLRNEGHDAKHLREENLQRLPNGLIFEKAVTEKRIVLTFDLDFGEIIALCKSHRVGVILFRLRHARYAHVIERLQIVLPNTREALERGSIVVVEETRFRIREFPH